jgi:hypothetical protein
MYIFSQGSLSTVGLHVLNSLDQLLFILKILLTSFTKQGALRCIYICKFHARFCIKLAGWFSKKYIFKKRAGLMRNRVQNLQV